VNEHQQPQLAQLEKRNVQVTFAQAKHLLHECGWAVYCFYQGQIFGYDQEWDNSAIDPQHIVEGIWYVEDDLLFRLLCKDGLPPQRKEDKPHE